MNAKDEQVSRSYIDLLSRWQLMNDYVKIHQLVPSLCGRSGFAINSVSSRFVCCMQAVGPCPGVNKLGETIA